MSDLIKKYVPERLADKNEVHDAVCEAPVLEGLDHDRRAAMMNRMKEGVLNAKLLWCRWHEVAGRTYELEFDWFRFLNPDISDPGVNLIQHSIRDDISKRFATQKFHTVVCILRGRDDQPISKFFDNLREIIPFERVIGFSLAPKRKHTLHDDELLSACGGKSVLIIEPLLIDRGLDVTYEKIKEVTGTINGVAILFEVKGVLPNSLLNYSEMQKRSGQKELRGGVVLDLRAKAP